MRWHRVIILAIFAAWSLVPRQGMNTYNSLTGHHLAPLSRAKAESPLVVVVGGGATGFYAADQLIKAGYRVLMINQDVAIGGGTRYFIRYDKVTDAAGKKPKIKMALMKIFLGVLKSPHFVGYYGGVRVGKDGSLSLEELLELNPAAVVLAAGSRGKKNLKIPGTDLKGVYDAYDIAQIYNEAPGFEGAQVEIGKQVAILGVGNVTADIIYWLADQHKQVDTITVFARRGPFEFKMKRPEVKEILPYLDAKALIEEIDRILEIFYRDRSLPYFADSIVDEETGERKKNEFRLTGNRIEDTARVLKAMLFQPAEIQRLLEGGEGPAKGPRVRFRFLTQPERLQGDNASPRRDKLQEMALSRNRLATDPASGQVQSIKTKTEAQEIIPVDTFIYSVGSAPDPELGMESEGGRLPTEPEFPYRLKWLPRTWVFGWARQPSKGLAGDTKQDVHAGIPDLVRYLREQPQDGANFQARLEQKLRERGVSWAKKEEVVFLHQRELERGRFYPPGEIEALLGVLFHGKGKQELLDTSL